MKTTTKQSTVRVESIPGIMADPSRGAIGLVGGSGGRSMITGEIAGSRVLPGTLAIETEHGVLHLEPQELVLISEEATYSEDHPWDVSWKIASTGSTPEQAAAKVWQDVFGRTEAGPDDACVFTVTDVVGGGSARVDLSSVSAQEEQ